jgi:hypothetical protein
VISQQDPAKGPVRAGLLNSLGSIARARWECSVAGATPRWYRHTTVPFSASVSSLSEPARGFSVLALTRGRAPRVRMFRRACSSQAFCSQPKPIPRRSATAASVSRPAALRGRRTCWAGLLTARGHSSPSSSTATAPPTVPAPIDVEGPSQAAHAAAKRSCMGYVARSTPMPVDRASENDDGVGVRRLELCDEHV